MSYTRTSCSLSHELAPLRQYKYSNTIINGDGFPSGTYKYINRLWTDGNNIYYSEDSKQYVLNALTRIWEAKTWNGLTEFSGSGVWTDGDNIYYSSTTSHYVLNKETDTWETKTWKGRYLPADSSYIWTDGTNMYYSDESVQYVLNKETNIWEKFSWNSPAYFHGQDVWTDGTYICIGHTHLLMPASKTYIMSNGSWTQTGESESSEAEIPDGYIKPKGSLLINDNNTTIDVSQYAEIEVATLKPREADATYMSSIQASVAMSGGVVGAVYKYIGETTDSYENGALYTIVLGEDGWQKLKKLELEQIIPDAEDYVF